jgi:hypothetical protein
MEIDYDHGSANSTRCWLLSDRIQSSSRLLLAACLLAACSQQATNPDGVDGSTTDPSCDPLLYSLGPIPAPHGLHEAPQWLDRGIDFARPAGQRWRTQFWLPWDLNDQQLYVVDPGGPIHLRLRSKLGADFAPAVTARMIVFVDGRQVQIRAADGSVLHLDFTVVDGLDDRTVSIAGDQLHVGLNHVQFFLHYGQQPSIPVTTAFPLTVLVGEKATSPDEPDTDLPKSGAFEPGFRTRAWWTHPTLGKLQLLYYDFLPLDGKSLAINLTLQAQPLTLTCGDESAFDKFAVVALLDGQTIPLGGNERLIATLRDGGEREFGFSLNLPKDGVPHELLILQLSGLGRPSRLKGGRLFPNWVPLPGIVSLVHWQ